MKTCFSNNIYFVSYEIPFTDLKSIDQLDQPVPSTVMCYMIYFAIYLITL